MKLETEEKKAIRILWIMVFSPDLLENEDKEWFREYMKENTNQEGKK